MRHGRSFWVRFLLVGLLGSALPAAGGCSRLMGTTPVHETIPTYPDGAEGLKALFTDVLTAAKNDNRDRVHDLFETLQMSPADLQALFGPRAPSLQHAYNEMMATLIHRGTVELVAMVYEKKWDTVEVAPMDFSEAGTAARPDDRALGKALVSHPTLYFVRLKHGDQSGARYNFFFYSDGKWRTGNLLGKLIAKQDAELTPPAPPR